MARSYRPDPGFTTMAGAALDFAGCPLDAAAGGGGGDERIRLVAETAGRVGCVRLTII